MDDLGLLAYYSYEWNQLSITNLDRVGQTMCRGSLDEGYDFRIQAVISSWMEFFTFIDGEGHRLTKAVSRLLAQRRDGNVIPQWTKTAQRTHLLEAFASSLDAMTVINPPTSVQQSRAELIQATKAYYTASEGFLISDSLLLNLRRVAGHILREFHMYGLIDQKFFAQNLEACADTLMNDHWEELFRKLEELFDTTEDPDNYLEHIRPIIRFSSDGQERLESSLMLYVRKRVQNVIEEMSVGERGASSSASTLLNIEKRLLEKADWEPMKIYNAHPIIHEAFNAALSDHPVLHDAVNDLLTQVSVLFQS